MTTQNPPAEPSEQDIAAAVADWDAQDKGITIGTHLRNIFGEISLLTMQKAFKTLNAAETNKE